MQEIIDNTVRDVEIILNHEETIKINSVTYYTEEDILNKVKESTNEKIVLVEDVFRNELMDNIEEGASFTIKVTYPTFSRCREYLGDRVEIYKNMYLARRVLNRNAERDSTKIIYVFSNSKNNIQELISKMLEQKENIEIERLNKKVEHLNAELHRSQIDINTLEVNMSSILTSVSKLESSVAALQKETLK